MQFLTKRSAEVIKIEHPVRGDDTRAWGPPYATYKAGSAHDGPGESAYFLAVSLSLPLPISFFLGPVSSQRTEGV